MKTFLTFISILLICVFFTGCGGNKNERNNVIVGISSDVQTFNPLYAFSLNEGNIDDLLFLPLVVHGWDTTSGSLTTSGMLAKKWEWSKDSSSITIYLRDDVYWSDGIKVTSADVVFSFDAYSDPAVQSRLYGSFEHFYTDSLNHIDIKKTFNVISPSEIKINFLPNTVATIYDIDFPIIPEHALDKIPRKEFPTDQFNFNPVTDGPFLLSEWKKTQSITLKGNTKSFLYNSQNIHGIIFKIVPDYYSRITQLKTGEVNVITDVKPYDMQSLKTDNKIKLINTKGRFYDYVGWNNIDAVAYKKNGKIVPNKLFGSAEVRRALSYAINRKEILEQYLVNYGQLSTGPVSPIFKSAIDTSLKTYDYDPAKARTLLANEGWGQDNGDGIMKKGTLKFSFTLTVPSGNPLRSYAAEIIKHDLEVIGIEVNIENMEMGEFIQSLQAKKLDAWISGWSIQIPPDLKTFWFSDLKTTPFNFPGYQDKQTDKLLEEFGGRISQETKNDLYKKIQKIIHNDEPVTFLYWVDNISAYNIDIKNMNTSPLGILHDCWKWRLK
jgi:peptide/nickel transport system substrate-binding protein